MFEEVRGFGTCFLAALGLATGFADGLEKQPFWGREPGPPGVMAKLPKDLKVENVLNVNVGVLGHVDRSCPASPIRPLASD